MLCIICITVSPKRPPFYFLNNSVKNLRPSTVGSFRMTPVKVKAAAAAAAAISLGQRAAAAAVDGSASIGVEHGIPRCRHSGDNISGVSNGKELVCGLCGACCAMAQRRVDWRLAAGQLNTVCCCCCRLAGVAPANSIDLTQQ